MNNKTPTHDFGIVNLLVIQSKKEGLQMNNFTKGLLLVLAIAVPIALTTPSVQAAAPKVVPAAKSAKVNKNTHTTKMHKHHYRHSAAKAQK